VISRDLLLKAEQHSWKMFRGNAMRTGISTSTLSRKPSLRWVMEVGPIISSPVFDDNVIYAATVAGRIFALKAYQRQIKWHSNIGSPIISSPLLQQDLLICATFDSWIKGNHFLGKNIVFALDVKTGKQVWQVEVDGDIFSSPCIANGMIVIGSLDKHIYAIDIKGNLKWKSETQGEIWSSPSFNGNELFVGSDDGFVYCLNLDGRLQWKTKLSGKIRSSSPSLSHENKVIFIGNHSGSMYSLKQSDGIILWDKQISNPVLASPAVLEDKVFFAASDRKVYCVHPISGSKIWEFETADRVWSSPVITENEGMLFFGSLDSHIYGLDILKGSQLWKFPTMNIIDSSPCVASNMLFVGGRDGLLYVFGLPENPSYIR
jgi:outer membrane protein assembly factor BamB